MKIFTALILNMLLAFIMNAQGDTMYVSGRHLYSSQGEKIVLRGMNIMSVWSPDKTGNWSMKEIAKTGANCARLVWTQSYGNKNELATLIDNCVANKMIAMPECHDATGKWNMLDTCISFWKDSVLKDAMQRNKQWTLLNIGNEVGDHSVTATQFEAEYKRAIDSIRGWGYTIPIVIDAPGWGQKVDILFSTWQAILNHDPLKNVIFSGHSYWSSTSNYNAVADKSVHENMPIIIGEGPSITLVSGCKILDYETGLTLLGENEIGWLSWSWGIVSNADCKPYFDHTTDGRFGNWETDYAKNLVVDHEYSLMKTSNRPTSMFSDGYIPVSGIQLSVTKETLHVEDTCFISVVSAPANADSIAYSMELIQDSAVVSLSNDSTYCIAVNEGTATLKVVHTATKNEDYYTLKVVGETTNIVENNSEPGVTVYPVPLNDSVLTIRFDILQSGKITLFTTSGQKVYEQDFSDLSYITISPDAFAGNHSVLMIIECTDGSKIEKVLLAQ